MVTVDMCPSGRATSVFEEPYLRLLIRIEVRQVGKPPKMNLLR